MSRDDRDAGEVRVEPFVRRPAVALGLLCLAACGEEQGLSSKDTDEPELLAAEVAATTTSKPVEIKTPSNFPISFVGNFGTGCRAMLRESKTPSQGLLQLWFHDYSLELEGSPTSRVVSKECTVILTVSGAQGYRIAIHRVTFTGSAYLFGPNMWAQFNQNVSWAGRGPAKLPIRKRMDKGYLDDWFDTQTYELQAAPVSNCFTAERPTDEIVVSSRLTLYNADTESAVASVASLTSNARPNDENVTLELVEQPCR